METVQQAAEQENQQETLDKQDLDNNNQELNKDDNTEPPDSTDKELEEQLTNLRKGLEDPQSFDKEAKLLIVKRVIGEDLDLNAIGVIVKAALSSENELLKENELTPRDLVERGLVEVMEEGDEAVTGLFTIFREQELSTLAEKLESQLVLLQKMSESLDGNETETLDEKPTEEDIVDADLLEEEIVESLPVKSYSQVVQETSGTLIDCLILDSVLLNELQKNSVLSDDTRSRILCRPNRPEQNRMLVGLLETLGPKSLKEFVAALRQTNQNFLANILDSYNYT